MIYVNINSQTIKGGVRKKHWKSCPNLIMMDIMNIDGGIQDAQMKIVHND